MKVRKQKNARRTRKTYKRIVPGLIFILISALMLGLVVKVSLSQARRGNSSAPQTSTDPVNDRWAYIMTDLVGQTRHFKGAPDAPVTILEFSDFQ